MQKLLIVSILLLFSCAGNQIKNNKSQFELLIEGVAYLNYGSSHNSCKHVMQSIDLLHQAYNNPKSEWTGYICGFLGRAYITATTMYCDNQLIKNGIEKASFFYGEASKLYPSDDVMNNDVNYILQCVESVKIQKK